MDFVQCNLRLFNVLASSLPRSALNWSNIERQFVPFSPTETIDFMMSFSSQSHHLLPRREGVEGTELSPRLRLLDDDNGDDDGPSKGLDGGVPVPVRLE